MDISKLDYFFSAAELQNFTKASERCNIAQTTMSKYIVSLEQEVGFTLFHRTNKGCYLTQQGQVFYTGMKKVYQEYTDVLGSIIRDESAELRIGINGEFYRLTSLQMFEDTYRNISLSLSFGHRDSLFDDLSKQKIHGIIMPDVIMLQDPGNADFVGCDLMSEEGLLTYSYFAQNRFPTIGDMLRTLPFITKSSDTAYHEYCKRNLKEHYGDTFQEILVVDSGSRQQLLVSLSQGFSIIPASEIASGMDLRQRSIGNEFIETLQLVYNKKHITPYLKEFIKFMRSYSG